MDAAGSRVSKGIVVTDVVMPFLPAERLVLIQWTVPEGTQVQEGDLIGDVGVFPDARTGIEDVIVMLPFPVRIRPS